MANPEAEANLQDLQDGEAGRERSQQKANELRALIAEKNPDRKPPYTGSTENSLQRHGGIHGLVEKTVDMKPGDEGPESPFTPGYDDENWQEYYDTRNSLKMRNRLEYLKERGRVGVLAEGTPRPNTDKRIHNFAEDESGERVHDPEAIRLASGIAKKEADNLKELSGLRGNLIADNEARTNNYYPNELRYPNGETPDRLGNNLARSERAVDKARDRFQDRVEDARRIALEIFERNPDRYRGMSQEEFTVLVQRYGEQNQELDNTLQELTGTHTKLLELLEYDFDRPFTTMREVDDTIYKLGLQPEGERGLGVSTLVLTDPNRSLAEQLRELIVRTQQTRLEAYNARLEKFNQRVREFNERWGVKPGETK